MRTRKGSARRQGNKRIFRRAKGYVGGRRKLLRTVKEAVVRSGVYAYRDRRQKRRKFRQLWVIRLNAAVREHGLKYSQFIFALKKLNIELDRKSLSEIAIVDPAGFKVIVDEAKAALGVTATAA